LTGREEFAILEKIKGSRNINRETEVPVVYITGAVGRASELHSWFRKEADNKFHYPHSVTHGEGDGNYIASFRTRAEYRTFLREFGEYISTSPWLGVHLQYSKGPPGSGETITPLYTGRPSHARPKGGYGDAPRSIAFKLDKEVVDVSAEDSTQVVAQPSVSSGNTR
jgi:hypothetical protein